MMLQAQLASSISRLFILQLCQLAVTRFGCSDCDFARYDSSVSLHDVLNFGVKELVVVISEDAKMVRIKSVIGQLIKQRA